MDDDGGKRESQGDVAPGQTSLDVDAPTVNPEFSEPGPNPAFTEATTPPSTAPLAGDDRILELEQRLEAATKRIENGAAVLERARRHG